MKFGGKSILVWGAIKADGTKMLLRCPPILNSSSYQCISDDALRDMYDRESVLIHVELHVINRMQLNYTWKGRRYATYLTDLHNHPT